MQPSMSTLGYWVGAVKGEVAVARDSFIVADRWCGELRRCRLKWDMNGFDERMRLRSNCSVWSNRFACDVQRTSNENLRKSVLDGNRRWASRLNLILNTAMRRAYGTRETAFHGRETLYVNLQFYRSSAGGIITVPIV